MVGGMAILGGSTVKPQGFYSRALLNSPKANVTKISDNF